MTLKGKERFTVCLLTQKGKTVYCFQNRAYRNANKTENEFYIGCKICEPIASLKEIFWVGLISGFFSKGLPPMPCLLFNVLRVKSL